MASNEIVLRALARLEGNQDFEKVLEHLRGLHSDAVDSCAHASEPIHIGREQGKQHVLGDFLKLAREARSILAKRS